MRIAAITYTFNEVVNLPIWLRYYGTNFGHSNLYVVDRESTDGNTTNMEAGVNKINLPRIPHDEWAKTGFISDIQSALLRAYDAVVYTDCDEIIVANPDRYGSLRDLLSE